MTSQMWSLTESDWDGMKILTLYIWKVRKNILFLMEHFIYINS